MIEQLNELSDYDFPDTEMIPDGWDIQTVPKMSDCNFRILVEEHNKLVRTTNTMIEFIERLAGQSE